jgi:hypothetical protein
MSAPLSPAARHDLIAAAIDDTLRGYLAHPEQLTPSVAANVVQELLATRGVLATVRAVCASANTDCERHLQKITDTLRELRELQRKLTTSEAALFAARQALFAQGLRDTPP